MRSVLQCFDEMSRGSFARASVSVNAKRLLGNFQQITANARHRHFSQHAEILTVAMVTNVLPAKFERRREISLNYH